MEIDITLARVRPQGPGPLPQGPVHDHGNRYREVAVTSGRAGGFFPPLQLPSFCFVEHSTILQFSTQSVTVLERNMESRGNKVMPRRSYTPGHHNLRIGHSRRISSSVYRMFCVRMHRFRPRILAQGDKEHADFVVKDKDMEETVDMLGRAIGILAKSMKGASFAQVPTDFKDLADAISAVVKSHTLATNDEQALNALLQQPDDDFLARSAPDAKAYESHRECFR